VRIYTVKTIRVQTVGGRLGKCVKELPSWCRQALIPCFALPAVSLLRNRTVLAAAAAPWGILGSVHMACAA